jgi:hypothetical protein
LTSSKNGVKVRLFADDVKIYTSVVNDIDNIKLQQVVDALAQWAIGNYLYLLVNVVS